MIPQDAVPDRQPCLFEALPTTEPRRRPGRRAAPRKVVDVEDGGTQAVPVPPPPTPSPQPSPPMWVRPTPVRVDAAALTNPDLVDLVRALPESSLSFLLVETVREVRKRLTPQHNADDEAEFYIPAPMLARAARTALQDLTEPE